MSGDSHLTDSEAAGWETTRADVVRELRSCLDESRPAATVTITDVEGAAYRRPGARLVVTEASSMGAVAVDALDDQLAAEVRTAISEGVPSTATYDLSAEDENALGPGLGANGVVDVLVDPVDASLDPALAAMARSNRAVVATVLSVDGGPAQGTQPVVSRGDRTTVFADGSTAGAEHLTGTGRNPLSDELLDAVSAALPDGSLAALPSSTTVSVPVGDAEISVFCNVYEPIPTVLVFGSQGDVRPVVRFARETGFRVVVATEPSSDADPERFPGADSVQPVHPSDLADVVEAPAHTYAVLMSHDFDADRLALDSLLETEVPYIGLLGPRKRFAAMCERFAEEDRPLSAAERERIAAPVGLDLGADEPSQIAMSVVAEVLAAVNDRSGGRLSEQGGHVHER